MFTVKTVTGSEMILADAGRDVDGHQLWRQVKVEGKPSDLLGGTDRREQ